MKLGYLTKFSPEEPPRAKRLGFDCLELHSASWHGDHVYSSPSERDHIVSDLKRSQDHHGITASAIAHYGPSLHLKGKDLTDSFTRAIDLARSCGANVVTAIAPREDPNESLPDNIPAFKKTYEPLAQLAADQGVKIAFENWPAFHGYPLKGNTLAHSPHAWELMFDAVPNDSLGLEFDPSHLFWQGIDHLAALRKFSSRVFHVHAKDTEIFHDKRNSTGIYGDHWWTYRIPGLGHIHWPSFINELHSLHYTGGLCIEHEDDRFDPWRKNPTPTQFEQGLQIGLDTLRPLTG